jgi:polyphosphate kinase 2 (PPK2 family)
MAKKQRRKDEAAELHDLQVELTKLQRHLIAAAKKVLVIFEVRDASGKLGKPSERNSASWYFQRFVPHLPAAGEIVFFNRSWYNNRAGVERVMAPITPDRRACRRPASGEK